MMLNRLFTEEVHIVNGLPPVADAFASASTQAVNCAEYKKVVFIVQNGVGTTGVPLFIVESCSDAAGDNNTAIPFYYRNYGNVGVTDVPTTGPTYVPVGATGVLATAGSNNMLVIEVNSAAVAAVSNQHYVRVTVNDTGTGTTDSPILGGILCLLCNPAYSGAAAPATVIT